MAERDADAIQREIEQARVNLAQSVDQLVYRTNPKRLATEARQTLLQRAQTQQGKAVLAGTGALVLMLIIRRIRRRGD